MKIINLIIIEDFYSGQTHGHPMFARCDKETLSANKGSYLLSTGDLYICLQSHKICLPVTVCFLTSAYFSPGPTSSGIVAVQVSCNRPCAGVRSSAIDTHREIGVIGGGLGFSCICLSNQYVLVFILEQKTSL